MQVNVRRDELEDLEGGGEGYPEAHFMLLKLRDKISNISDLGEAITESMKKETKTYLRYIRKSKQMNSRERDEIIDGKSICRKSKLCLTMEVKIAKMSKKGQIVIPSQIRKDAHLEESDEFLVFGKDDTVVLKKIDKKSLEKTFDEIVEPLRKKTEEFGLKSDDLEAIIHEYREKKAKSGT